MCYNKPGFISRADWSKAAKHCDALHLERKLEKSSPNTISKNISKLVPHNACVYLKTYTISSLSVV